MPNVARGERRIRRTQPGWDSTSSTLESVRRGGTAKPFKTHVNALDVEMYLAISHELYLKRLIVAGYDRVYTIGRYFRNEGIDRTHHPEFSMLETMTAYENYEFNMNLIEDLFRHIGQEVFGRTEFTRTRQPLPTLALVPRGIGLLRVIPGATGANLALTCA